jgi:hypothetical protein
MSPEQMNVTVDAALRARIIDHIAAKLTEFYIYPDVAKKMVDAMRAHQKKGDYDSITDGYAFASRLTGDLKAVSHDGHLRVGCSPRPVPPDDPADDDQSREQPASPEFVELMHQRNCAVVKVEHLPPNIGYLKFNGFEDPRFCATTAVAALNFVADSAALIIDLRDNGGGDGDMANLILSHFFAERTHVLDEYTRAGDRTTEVWTDSTVAGRRFVDKPLFILTAKRTFSAAEAMTFALQNLHRATVVGENTLGGAHRTDAHRIDDHFTARVPYGRTSDPVTKADYEGVGIRPDLNAPAAEALDVARELAEQAIRTPRPAAPAKAR